MVRTVQCWIHPEVNLSLLEPANVRAVYLARLPFRLKVGDLHKFTLPNGEGQIWCRNKVSAPQGSDLLSLRLGHGNFESLNTDLLIVLDKLDLDKNTFSSLKEAAIQNDPKVQPSSTFHAEHRAKNIVNRLLIAYGTSTGDFGGVNSVIKLFTYFEFMTLINYEITLILPAESEIEDGVVDDLFQQRPLAIGGQQFMGSPADLDGTAIESVNTTLQSIDEFPHNEYAFLAKSFAFQGDYRYALLMACVALEGVHAQILQQTLLKELDEFAPASKKGESFSKVRFPIKNLLRERGLFVQLPLTCLTLLNDSDRPSPLEIQKCLEAVEIRNQIMHLKADEVKKHHEGKYSDAYGHVIHVFLRLSAAFEKVFQQ